MNFINLPDKFYIEGIQRIDIRDKIFREIAANMLIHREYSHPFPAKFLIFSDKVVTENWTKPAGHNPITIENLETHPKNPMVARVFKELGWVEELGSGRKNIIKYSPYYYENYRIDLTKITQRGPATTDRYIKILKDAGIIKLKGSRKTGGYYLTPKAKNILKKT